MKSLCANHIQPIMKTLKATFAALALCTGIAGAQNAAKLPLIPQPAHAVQTKGTFVFKNTVKTFADSYKNDSIGRVLSQFERKFTLVSGLRCKRVKRGGALQLKRNDTLKGEGYKLNVSPKKILIEAARPVGFFYALQTLQQLFPSRAVAAGTKAATTIRQWQLPAVNIEDAPRFGWRGFMLDEGRHFFGKKEVRKILDVMAYYKMNRFHWHLTEDQGWRIEIKKYPKLTETGAWRNSCTLGYAEVKPDGVTYGGYYTQDDAREIVDYARERFIEIIPEIDLPGHSQAAVASYPEFLACDPQNAHAVWSYQGISTDVINVANPRAVEFAKNVIDELGTIFPYSYIHLGGDECPTNKWENNADCRKLLETLDSKNYRDLQTNFYYQLKKHIDSKPKEDQRHLIFWNEVLHGNTLALGKDVTIMAWTGAEAAAKSAAQRGMSTILSPQIPYYINRRQSNDPNEPRSQGTGTETVEAVYNYIPMKNVDKELQSQYLGVQANFWTEWVEDAATLQYLMFPRLAAVAEAAWTPQSLRNYNDFLERLQQEPSFYEASGVNYGKHVFR